MQGALLRDCVFAFVVWEEQLAACGRVPHTREPGVAARAGMLRCAVERQCVLCRQVCPRVSALLLTAAVAAAQNGTAGGALCNTFSLLGDACLDANGTAAEGCAAWKALCSTAGTKVSRSR